MILVNRQILNFTRPSKFSDFFGVAFKQSTSTRIKTAAKKRLPKTKETRRFVVFENGIDTGHNFGLVNSHTMSAEITRPTYFTGFQSMKLLL